MMGQGGLIDLEPLLLWSFLYFYMISCGRLPNNNNSNTGPTDLRSITFKYISVSISA